MDNKVDQYSIKRKELIDKWEKLTEEMELVFQLSKSLGGTKSHAVGSIKDKNKELLQFAKKYW